ncbi:hypothetical protein Hanom_Chr01g00035001 [Helianthus anomalus]
MLVGSSILANAIMEVYEGLGRKEEETVLLRAGAEAMAAFEKLKQTGTWAASVGLKQELNNLKAANTALIKEEAADEAAAKEADADRSKLNKVFEDLKVEVQNRVTILEEVTARASEAKARAREAAEARDSLTTSLNQLKADRDCMRDHGIGHIVGTVLDAPENATAINDLKESGFHGIDTEALYAAAVDAYNNLSLSAIEDTEKCLEADDYVDRLRLFYERPEEEEAAGGAKQDAGTRCIKED